MRRPSRVTEVHEMRRGVLAVTAGFLAMSGFAFIAFMAAFFLMGDDTVFLHGTSETSARWAVVGAILGFVAAFIGGLVCGCISPRSGPMWALIGVAVVFGLGYALINLAGESSASRSGDTGLLEAQFSARSPTWLL